MKRPGIICQQSTPTANAITAWTRPSRRMVKSRQPQQSNCEKHNPKPDEPEPNWSLSFRPKGEILSRLKSKISPFGRNDNRRLGFACPEPVEAARHGGR